MNKSELRRTLRDAQKKLDRELRAREEIETRIARLKRMISSMNAVIDGPKVELAESNLKDEVRVAMRAVANSKPATMAEIRKALRDLNASFEEHKNPVASIVNVLKRLINTEPQEVGLGPLRDGKKTYVWLLGSYGSPRGLRNWIEDRTRDMAKQQKRKK